MKFSTVFLYSVRHVLLLSRLSRASRAQADGNRENLFGGPYEKIVPAIGSRIFIAINLTEPNRGSSINVSRSSYSYSLLS
jgi:hypothetical protein